MEIVKLIFRKKAAVLVEYQKNGIPVRVSVPANKVHQISNSEEVEISEKVLREGIPYGVPWSVHITDTTINGMDVENELHKLGIWTVDDYKRNPGALQNAVMAVTVNIVRSIVQTVKEYSSKEVMK